MFNWHALSTSRPGTTLAGSRDRLRAVWTGFAVCVLLILLRAWLTEFSLGPDFRQAALRPLERTRAIPASRGRIVDRSGVVLAEDATVLSLAVHYRWLEEPPQADWLRRTARARLKKSERSQPDRVAAAQAAVLDEREALHRRLAELSGLEPSEWQRRCDRIQRRVEAVAAHVNERRSQTSAVEPAPLPAAEHWWDWIQLAAAELVRAEPTAQGPIVVAEQEQHHIVVDQLASVAAEALREQFSQLPAVRIVEQVRRRYPQGALAANLVGHVAPGEPAAVASVAVSPERRKPDVGQLGVERAFEEVLRSHPGSELRQVDRRGQVVSTEVVTPPQSGGDVRLTIDAELQRGAEAALDRACSEKYEPGEGELPIGGAIVAVDISSGEILAAAAAPRFDPCLFAGDPHADREQVLGDPRRPLFDRATKMALPPGSVFKVVSALALLASGTVTPEETYACRGYLHQPDRQRCYLFRRFGVGHGELNLAGALAESCNVYFFHYAEQAGAAPLVHWGRRCGCGRPTGIELGEEAAGQLPSPENLRSGDRIWRPADTQNMAIGQGGLTMTPLQAARLLAAVANGGTLLPLHLTPAEIELSPAESDRQRLQILPEHLAEVRRGLERVVADPNGTAHAVFQGCRTAVAGKTGTAETGGDRPDHAWFAGYAPCGAPRVAFAVALEHGGSSTRAARAARELVELLQKRGLLGDAARTTAAFPPGRG